MMQRHALAPVGPTREQVLVAVPRRATGWTLAATNRGLHRLLVPIGACLRGLDALRYIEAHFAPHVGRVHLLNVQKPIMSGDVTSLVSASVVASLRKVAGQRALAKARDAFEASGIPTTSEVAFGDVADVICRVAEVRGCSGIVLAKHGLELQQLIRGSVAARVLLMSTVPVTVVNARGVAEHARQRIDAKPREVVARSFEQPLGA
jgi:nucleotide-binding universal stress UspA family protein